LNSIIKQSYKNLEIILLNDGSIDNSLNICKSYKAMDSRIVLIDKENSGVSDTRNYGIEKANGKYIIFVDSDDCINEDMISIMYNTLIKNDTDVVRCSNNIVKDNKIIKIERNPVNICNKKIPKENFNEVINYLFGLGNIKINSYTPLLLIKKSKIPKFNIDFKYMEDTLFYVDLLKNIDSIYFINNELYNYRYNEQSVTKNVTNVVSNINDMLNVTDKIILENNLNKEVVDNIQINRFYIFVTKLDILIKNNKEINQQLYDTFKEKICPYINKQLLNKIKKIEFDLLKNKHYKMFEFVEKIKLSLKK
jgi:glycosyltransferase involved in cell wall biosynthesis